jgi:hypothetical protein
LQIAGRKSNRQFAKKLRRGFSPRAIEKAQRTTAIPHGLWLWEGFSGGDGEVKLFSKQHTVNLGIDTGHVGLVLCHPFGVLGYILISNSIIISSLRD